mmetsp:Transcript_35050/g.88742  ORF Transcript_35050/g.88742 Transcript_35050/m.88742 type:complete len:296 (+) Transcript_35050:706-1593(+)
MHNTASSSHVITPTHQPLNQQLLLLPSPASCCRLPPKPPGNTTGHPAYPNSASARRLVKLRGERSVQRGLAPLLQHGAQARAQRVRQRRRHRVADLPVLVVHVAREAEGVGEALRARALAHRHDAVLRGVEHLAHLAHGLRVGGRRGEVAVEVQAPKQAAPAVVAVHGVGQAPGHQRLPLVQLAARVVLHDVHEHAPVGARLVLGDAAAPLQVELVHLLADVVAQHAGALADEALERGGGRVRVRRLQLLVAVLNGWQVGDGVAHGDRAQRRAAAGRVGHRRVRHAARQVDGQLR